MRDHGRTKVWLCRPRLDWPVLGERVSDGMPLLSPDAVFWDIAGSRGVRASLVITGLAVRIITRTQRYG